MILDPKNSRLDVRISSRDLYLLDKACEILHKSRTDMVRFILKSYLASVAHLLQIERDADL